MYTKRGDPDKHHRSHPHSYETKKTSLSAAARACIDNAMPQLMPQATPQELETIFRDTVKAEGSEQNAINTFNNGVKVILSGIVFGSTVPPPNAATMHFRLTNDLGILYHPTIPRALQQGADFTWNFYITGINEELLPVETSWRHNDAPYGPHPRVKVTTLDLKGEWELLELLTVPPGARVRVEHYAHKKEVHELIFPHLLHHTGENVTIHTHLLPLHL
ncbi:hypothetical protein B0H16DRAFT_1625860, partial [Mycena metata]